MSDKDFSFALSSEDSKVIKGFAICLMLWHHLFATGLYSGDSSAVLFLAGFGKVCVVIFACKWLRNGSPVFKGY